MPDNVYISAILQASGAKLYDALLMFHLNKKQMSNLLS